MSGFYSKTLKISIPAALAAIFLFLALPASAKEPSDPRYASQAAMWRQINAPAAWDVSIGSDEVVVAMIDTGPDTKHPDLADNIWINKDEIPGNGEDDDNNGYIDDVNGWNFVENNNNPRPKVVLGSDDDEEAVNHGTLVAGLVGALGDNGRNGVGLNWKIKIMPLRAMNNLGSGSYSDIVKAINYAIANGASVISLSVVGENTDAEVKTALRRAYDKGVVVVAAAGNEGKYNEGDLDSFPLYPICLDRGDKENWLLGVTAVDATDRLASFAGYGSCVDLAAPGKNIFSIQYFDPFAGYLEDFDGAWQGTSFAAPLVAGAAALVKSVNPEWQAPEIIKALLSAADGLESLNPFFIGRLGYGRLNVGRAVEKALEAKIARENVHQFYFSGWRVYLDYPFAKKTIYLGDAGGPVSFLNAGDINADGRDEVAVLARVKNGQKILVLTDDGQTLAEFVLPRLPSTNIVLTGLKIEGNGVLTVSGRNKATKKAVIYRFNLAGEAI